MLQPKRREQLDANIKELLANGGSNADIEKLAQDFTAKFGSEVEKKNPIDTASTSTTQKESTGSVPKDGSLGTPKIKIKDERLEGATTKDITSLAKPRRVTTDIAKLESESEAFKQLANKKLFNYRQATKIPQEEKKAVLEELKAKKEKEGVINNIKSGLKQGWNAFVDVIGVGGSEETKETWKIDADPFADEKKEAIEFFKEQKIKPTDLQIEQKADEIFIKNKTLQLKQDKINDYLGSLDEQEKTYLEVDAQKRFPTISKKRQDILNRISMNEKALAKSIKNLKNPMTEQDAAMIESEISKITKYLDEDKMLFSKASEELGTAKDEFEAFKRNYNMLENAKARIVASISEGAVSFIEGLDYLGTLGGNIGSKKQSEELFKDTEKARKGIQEYREQYRPDNKELTLDNFFEYSTDLLANQSGTLLTIAGAGSTGGASILGLGQAGQTYAEMRKANKNGTNYAPWQMVVAPAVSGISTGILSASPTFETLKNAKNVWKAAIKDPLAKEIYQKAIKKTSQSITKQVFGDTKKEVVTELLDNTIQNAVKKDILGDKSVGYFDNSWQVLKDTALMTGLLNAGALPQVTMEGVRMFSDYESGKKLNNNGQKIARLLPQLDNENISEASRKAIELEVDKATSENTQIINSTLDKISKLPDSDVKKVVDNNKKQGELTSESEAIKEDNSIEVPAKKILLDAKKQEYENIQKSTNEIINAEVKIPTTKPEVKPKDEVQEQTEIVEPQEIIVDETASTTNTPANFKIGEVEEFHHASSSKRNGRLKPNNAPQFGTGVYFSTNKELVEDEYGKENTTTVKLNVQKPVYTNTKQWNKVEELAVENAIADYNKKNNLLEDEMGYKNNWDISEIPSKFISDAAKELGYDAIIDEGSSQYENEIVVLDESKIIYPEDEKQTTTNAPIDGNVRPTVEPLGEVAIEQKPTAEIVTEESTQSANDVGASEEVTKIKVYRGEPTKIDVPNKNIMWVTPNKELADEYSYDLGIGKKGSLEKGIVTESEIEVPKNPLILNYKGDTEVRGKDIGGGLRNTLKDAYKSGKISVEKAREISEKISKYEDLAGSDLEAWHTKINKPTVTKLFVEIAKDLGFDGIQTNEGRKGQDVGYGLFKETSVFGTSEAEVDINDIENFLNEQFSAKKPTEVKETPKPKKETTSNKYVEKPINEIKTDETRFQNRTELDEEQLKSIKENWNENELDPVVIWKDDKGESFILAGHHRLEAAKQLGKKAIDARYFKGTEAEAIKYATEKSNANRTMEQSYDRAKKLRQLREGGASKKEIDEFLKGDGKNKRFVTSVSYLNPKGKLMDMLKSFGKSGDKETVRLTESAADWIGDARKFYPELTDSHEDELYNYLINKGNLKKLSNKVDFRLKIEKFANQIRLFPNEPLNLESRVFKGDLEVKKEQEIDVVKKEIKSLENEREKGTPTEKRLNEITELISINNKKLGVLNKQLAEAKAGDKAQGDLFDLASAEVVEMINQKQITDEQANEFINDDRKAEEIEPIVEVIESKAKSDKKVELEEVVAEVDAVVENKKETPKVEKPTEVGRMVSASSRFRPAQRVDFEKPVIGPNGNKLISYQWAYEWTEQPNREGEIKPKRISNWDQAESSASTGRDIVHQFTIEKPNGETITVSSESVPFELGYAEKSQMKDLPSLVSAVKTLAKNKMKLAILEAQLKEYNDLKAKYEKIIPEIKEIKEPTNFGPVQEAYEKGEHKVFAIEDVWVRQYNKYNERTRSYEPINNPDKFTTLSVKEDWVNKRVKEDGGKFPRDIFDVKRRTERQEKKIGLVNPQEIDVKQQLKDKANAEVNNDLVSKEYYDNFQKEFPNTLLAIEEKSGLITIFENGETREIEPFEFVKELKNALAKGYKGIGKVTRKVVDTETKKLKANAEVDKIAQKVKDFLPSAKGVEGAKAQGFTQDQIIDLVASAVKQLISAGIEINEAIRQVTESIKERFGVDVNIDDVKAKLKETEIPQDFERKQGKKSVAGRMASGNSAIIKKAIANNSLDYEIENQKEAKAKADAFVDEVGFDNALIAVRDGSVDGAQGAFIYARAIEILEQEINDLKGEDKLDAIADYQKLLDEIAVELDLRSRKNGQFIAALANIYYSSKGRYNLTKMVKDYRAANKGEISKEVLEKLKNVEEKLKESEAKLADLEAKKRIEEENEAFNNILEAVARKKRINTNAKITDKQKAKAFADKLRSFKISNKANLSAATPFSIAYDLAIETAAKALELTGLVSDAIKAGVDSIRNANLSKDEQEQALSDLFDLFDDSDVNTGQKGMMSIDQEGKLRIPHSLIREKVENGIDNIDDLVAELMSDAQELFPDLDFTERQVRDIVTGYGKISNPTQDEIETQISIMKSLGKIASGLEDVKKGQRPLRSGQQRREPTMKERTEMKKLKALLRDLPLADADITKAYKTALDAIKKRLSNEIEELDEQIAKGEKRKGEKSVIEYDQEAKDLKAIRDSKKAELDELVGKPELTEQQKIERAEKTLQKRLDDLQQKINSNEIDYAKKPETVTSDKLEEMRKLKKEYEAQIQKMRQDAGLAEERLIDIAKRGASKRLAALKERIANGDFERRKRKPTPTDAELDKIKSEIAEQKEILDKEMYKVELKNRRIEVKALDLLKDLLSIPKILSFTADLSFVGVQPVTQIYKMGANSLINLAKTGKLKGTFRDAMTKTFKAMASPDFEQKFMRSVKANPNYQLWKESKLGIVESHYKESAKAEVFQHNALSTVFNILGDYMALKGYEKAGNIIKNYVNIISVFERGQTVFENIMRINRFQEGVDLLKAQGFNPVDDIQEYRKVAAAVNTLTGRANTGSKVASALRELNGTVFSSFSNWAAGVNQLNPYWYYTLTPTARKMALTDVAHHIVGAGSMISMAALYALGQDDDDEDKVVVQASPTSSDFAIIRVGNLRIDPWAGKKTTVVAFSRLVNGGKTDKYGNFKEYGIEYEDEDWIDLPLEYAGNKIAPGPRFFLDRFLKTKEVEYKGASFREDKYGVDFKKSKYLTPLIFENFREVSEEQPNLFGKATMALSYTGLINTNVYGGMKEGFKDMPDDLLEKEYKVKIQKIKDNEKILEFNANKLAKEYNEKKIKKLEVYKKVDSLVGGDNELFDKTMKMIVNKVNKEELKTLVTDPFYFGLKKERNPEVQAILFYGKFKDDKGMSEKDKKERDKNLRYVEFEKTPKFIKAYQELKKEKTPK